MKQKDVLREAIKIKLEDGFFDNLGPFEQQLIFGRCAYKVDEDGNFVGWLSTEELLNLDL